MPSLLTHSSLLFCPYQTTFFHLPTSPWNWTICPYSEFLLMAFLFFETLSNAFIQVISCSFGILLKNPLRKSKLPFPTLSSPRLLTPPKTLTCQEYVSYTSTPHSQNFDEDGIGQYMSKFFINGKALHCHKYDSFTCFSPILLYGGKDNGCVPSFILPVWHLNWIFC